MQTLTISPTDPAALAAVAASEVGHWRGSQLTTGVAGVVDTVLNRAMNPGFPSSITQSQRHAG
jgi:hypothetical protein